jgi:hypothetical protein
MSFGVSESQLKMAPPCPTDSACNAAPILHLSKQNTPGLEADAGYRVIRFLSGQVEIWFGTNGNDAHIREVLPNSLPGSSDQRQPKAGIDSSPLIRPALRADWPLVPSWLSAFATYGLQLEDFKVHTEVLTGRIVTAWHEGGCTLDDNGVTHCTLSFQGPTPEVGYNTYRHRDWRQSVSVGFDALNFDLFGLHPCSVRAEYMPRGNGRVESYTIGISMHW